MYDFALIKIKNHNYLLRRDTLKTAFATVTKNSISIPILSRIERRDLVPRLVQNFVFQLVSHFSNEALDNEEFILLVVQTCVLTFRLECI